VVVLVGQVKMLANEDRIVVEHHIFSARDSDADRLHVADDETVAPCVIQEAYTDRALADEGFGRSDVEGSHADS
jgi:hypothetical protein